VGSRKKRICFLRYLGKKEVLILQGGTRRGWGTFEQGGKRRSSRSGENNGGSNFLIEREKGESTGRRRNNSCCAKKKGGKKPYFSDMETIQSGKGQLNARTLLKSRGCGGGVSFVGRKISM